MTERTSAAEVRSIVRLLLRLLSPVLLVALVVLGLRDSGQLYELPKVLPLFALAFWFALRRPSNIVVRAAALLLVATASVYSFGGQILSVDQTLNRITHGGFAALLCLIGAFEIRALLFSTSRLGRTSLRVEVAVGLIAGGATVTAGVFMEFAEAISMWAPLGGLQRFQDTILDLAADVAGTVAAVLVFWGASWIRHVRCGG